MKNNLSSTKPILCPSAQPSENSTIIGIVQGTVEAPLVEYLPQPLPVTEELIALTGDLVAPTEVFRIAAPCAEGSCKHFDGKTCTLATRVVENLPAVTQSLPTCTIRQDCRWFKQHGVEACRRCLQVVTKNYDPKARLVAG